MMRVEEVKEMKLAWGVTDTAGLGEVHRLVPRVCGSKKEEQLIQVGEIAGQQLGVQIT